MTIFISLKNLDYQPNITTATHVSLVSSTRLTIDLSGRFITLDNAVFKGKVTYRISINNYYVAARNIDRQAKLGVHNNLEPLLDPRFACPSGHFPPSGLSAPPEDV